MCHGVRSSLSLPLAVNGRTRGALNLYAPTPDALGVDQALGVLMAGEHTDHDGAFALLRESSQRQNRKLRDVAYEIVQAATGHRPPPTPFNDPSERIRDRPSP